MSNKSPDYLRLLDLAKPAAQEIAAQIIAEFHHEGLIAPALRSRMKLVASEIVQTMLADLEVERPNSRLKS